MRVVVVAVLALVGVIGIGMAGPAHAEFTVSLDKDAYRYGDKIVISGNCDGDQAIIAILNKGSHTVGVYDRMISYGGDFIFDDLVMSGDDWLYPAPHIITAKCYDHSSRGLPPEEIKLYFDLLAPLGASQNPEQADVPQSGPYTGLFKASLDKDVYRYGDKIVISGKCNADQATVAIINEGSHIVGVYDQMVLHSGDFIFDDLVISGDDWIYPASHIVTVRCYDNSSRDSPPEEVKFNFNLLAPLDMPEQPKQGSTHEPNQEKLAPEPETVPELAPEPAATDSDLEERVDELEGRVGILESILDSLRSFFGF